MLMRGIQMGRLFCGDGGRWARIRFGFEGGGKEFDGKGRAVVDGTLTDPMCLKVGEGLANRPCIPAMLTAKPTLSRGWGWGCKIRLLGRCKCLGICKKMGESTKSIKCCQRSIPGNGGNIGAYLDASWTRGRSRGSRRRCPCPRRHPPCGGGGHCTCGSLIGGSASEGCRCVNPPKYPSRGLGYWDRLWGL